MPDPLIFSRKVCPADGLLAVKIIWGGIIITGLGSLGSLAIVQCRPCRQALAGHVLLGRHWQGIFHWGNVVCQLTLAEVPLFVLGG